MNGHVVGQAFQGNAWPGSDFRSFLTGTAPGEHPDGNLALGAHAALKEETWQVPADHWLDRDPCDAMTGCIVALRVTAKQATSSGKCYALDDAGQVRTDIRHWTWFEPVVVGFDGLFGLHAAFEGVASGEHGYASVVRGGLLPGGGKTIARRKQAGRDKKGQMRPAGLRDKSQPWVVLDFDKMPNPHGYDPRDPGQGQQAIGWLLSLMPACTADIGFSWAWSSSACLKDPDDRVLPRDEPPGDLRLHMRVLLDEDCDEALVRRFLKALNGHMRNRLCDLYGLAPGRVLDSSTATYNQPVFVAPTFVPPLADPFADSARSGLHLGHPVPVRLCMEACLPDLLPPARREIPVPSPIQEPEAGMPGVEGGQDEDMFMDLEAFDILTDNMAAAARRQEFGRNPHTKAGRYRVFAGRALQDLERLVAARMGISGSPWRHGIPEGQRTLSLLMLATLARRAGQTPRQAMSLCERWALTMVEGGGEVFHRDWRGKAEAQVRQTRAYPGKAALLDMFDVGLDDQVAMTALVSDKVEARKLRQARAGQGKTARGTAPVVKVPQAQQAAAAGVSLSTWKRQQAAQRKRDRKRQVLW